MSILYNEKLEELMKIQSEMSEEENEFVLKMADEIKELIAIDCSYCGYCLKECPAGIPIPDFFELYNLFLQDEQYFHVHLQVFESQHVLDF